MQLQTNFFSSRRYFVAVDWHSSVNPFAASADGRTIQPVLSNVNSPRAKGLPSITRWFRRNSNRIFFSLHVVALRNCSRNLRRSYFVSHRCHHVIINHHVVIMNQNVVINYVITMDGRRHGECERLCCYMLCLVTTHTHVNYKLLALNRICYRVYTEITNNKLYVKWTTSR